MRWYSASLNSKSNAVLAFGVADMGDLQHEREAASQYRFRYKAENGHALLHGGRKAWLQLSVAVSVLGMKLGATGWADVLAL